METAFLFVVLCSFSFWTAQSAPLPPVACPSGWFGYTEDQTCYKPYHNIRLKWENAKRFCWTQGGDLAVIKDMETLAFVEALLAPLNTYWIDMKNDNESLINRIDGGNNGTNMFGDLTHDLNETSCDFLMMNSSTFETYTALCDTIQPFVCQTAPTMCPVHWTGYTDNQGKTSCIKVYRDDRKSWDEARRQCHLDGGHLITIGSQDLDGFVKDLIHGPNGYWIENLNPLSADIAQLDLQRNLTNGDTCKLLHNVDYQGYRVYNNECEETHPYVCEKDGISSCPVGWTLSPNRNKCYRLYRKDYRNWNDASAVCKKYNGQLLTVDSTEDYAFIIENISSGPDSSWIGAKKRNTGPFLWDENSQQIYYSGWGVSITSSTLGEACGYMAQDQRNNMGYIKWDSTLCSEKKPYICQKDDEPHPGAFTCPYGYTAFKAGGKCFKVVYGFYLNWEGARSYCRNEGGDLSVVHDNDADNFLAGLLTYPHDYWIGMTRKLGSRVYKWLDNTRESIESSGWMPNEPSYYGERCVGYWHSSYHHVFKTSRYFYWNDFICNYKLGITCEQDGNDLSDVKEVDIDGRAYYISYGEIQFSVLSQNTGGSKHQCTNSVPIKGIESTCNGPKTECVSTHNQRNFGSRVQGNDVESSCQSHHSSLTQLFIQSSDHFNRIQAWVSNSSFLQGDDIWIRTNKPLFWDFNTWSNNEYISPGAWVSDIQNRTCSQQEKCCVVLTNDANRPGHYLANTRCSEEALYLCVKENQLPTTTIPPSKLEHNNVKSLATLKKLTKSSEGQNNKCPCRCGMTFEFNITTKFLDQIKDKIVKELIVKTDNLSSTVNKKISAKDSRPSSQTFGYLAIAMISIPVILIVALDLTRFCQQSDAE